MSVITIREREQTQDGFKAIVILNRHEYPITVSNPFSTPQETLLEWYFEDWLISPALDTLKAQSVVNSLKDYGNTLFNQVFADRRAYTDYQAVRGNLEQIIIESETPDFQGLHWEAIQDPDAPRPLAVDVIMVRKPVRPPGVTTAVMGVSPTINVLVVVARPDEDQDVAYRTISRPMMELIVNGKLRVKVDILRPGTYKALSQHLEAKGKGFYHLIHFDCHGSLLSYQQYQKGVQRGRYFYQRGWGLSEIPSYEGVKGFLFFEGENQGEATPVEASELAGLLTGKGIPVCILNACQSGKQIDTGNGASQRETSLGSRLMDAGMNMVVAMSYSVTVSAAKLMMEHLYKLMFDGMSLSESIRLSRWELYHNKSRKAYFNYRIDLEDWLLPVVYVNDEQVFSFNLREFTRQERIEYWERVDKSYRFPLPTYGFVGRDLEILKLEKALLRDNILLLQGMGGTGKTTLLSYLRQWWTDTHYCEDVFYFGYDQKAWSLDQIVFDICNRVYGRFEALEAQAMPETVRVSELIQFLRSDNYVLMLDNLESITGQELAIPNTLPEAERNKLKDFLTRLVGGKTKVVLGSRSGESWLKDSTFKGNVYYLQGLDKESRADLAEVILKTILRDKPQRIKLIQEDEDFKRLMKLLAGYPLAMEVVLGNLRTQTPEDILQGLEAADVKLDTGNEDKTRSIIKCVEYSHSNLSDDAQRLLLCLAPFSGFIYRDATPNYIKELQKLEPFQDYPFAKFDEAIQEAINWGLLSGLELSPGVTDERYLTIQPVFPFFLKTKVKEWDIKTQEALKEGFKHHYLGGAAYYGQLMDSKEPEKKQLGIFFCRLEYENLYHGLEICLEKQETVSIFFCLEHYFDLINDPQSNLKLSQFVCQALENYPASFLESENGCQIASSLARLGNSQLHNKLYPEAKNSYEKSLQVTELLQGVEIAAKEDWKARIYHDLGIVAQELREWSQARLYHLQALRIYIEYSKPYEQAGKLPRT